MTLYFWSEIKASHDVSCSLILACHLVGMQQHYLYTAATAAVATLDPQNGAAPSSHVVLVTCVKNLYRFAMLPNADMVPDPKDCGFNQ